MKRHLIILLIGIIGLLTFFALGCAGKKAGGEKAAEKKIAYYRDPMNPAITVDHPGKAPCGMDYVPVYAGDVSAKGIHIDPAVVQNIGVLTEEVKKRDLKKEIRTSGTVDLNESAVYTISIKFMGWADKLHISYTGERVTRGQPLLDIYSPELVSTQEEYLQSLRYAKSLAPDASEEARRGSRELAESSRARLLNWDVAESEIQSLVARGTVNKIMTLRSPDNGVVLEKMVEQGKQIEPGMPLYRIADLSTVWVMADIYQQDLALIKIGQRADVELSSLVGKIFEGRVAYLSPVVDQAAKTAQARIEVRNTPDLQFKPGLFATVRIASLAAVAAVAIPEQAVIHSGERNIAVIALGGGYFDPREVQLGLTAGGYVQVLRGVEAGEKVVTSAQFLIDSESNLKNAINQMGGAMPGMNMPSSPAPGKDEPAMSQPEPTMQPPSQEDRGNGSMPGMDMK
jgi:RND family efflux transporter MFP subunit